MSVERRRREREKTKKNVEEITESTCYAVCHLDERIECMGSYRVGKTRKRDEGRVG